MHFWKSVTKTHSIVITKSCHCAPAASMLYIGFLKPYGSINDLDLVRSFRTKACTDKTKETNKQNRHLYPNDTKRPPESTHLQSANASNVLACL